MLNPNLAYILGANAIPSGGFVHAFVKIHKFHEIPCFWAKLRGQIFHNISPCKSFIQYNPPNNFNPRTHRSTQEQSTLKMIIVIVRKKLECKSILVIERAD